MPKYNSQAFIDRVSSVVKNKYFSECPFCGGNRFTTTENYSAILIGEELPNLSLGPHIPAGMVICEKCGHIDFFALGALGLLKKEDQENGEKTDN